LFVPHSISTAFGLSMPYSGAIMKVNTANLDIEWYRYLSESSANSNELGSVTLLNREPNLIASGCLRSTLLA
jgi:hypothetical protein